MANRLKLRRYLRELVLNQKRIVKAATQQALQDKLKEMQGESPGAQANPQHQELAAALKQLDAEQARANKAASQIQIVQTPESLRELDQKLKASKTPYFAGSHQPTKTTDLSVYERLKRDKSIPTPTEHPNLFAWFTLIDSFSSKVKSGWSN